jgi:HAD superfamily hydrolase (TIGR01509 family)
MEGKSIYLHQIKQMDFYTCFNFMEKIDQKKYKNIIFDLGGVILNIDYNLTVEAFKKLGLNDFNQLFSKASQTNLFDAYEIGQISSEKFIEELQIIIGKNITKKAIINAWNAMLLDLPKERLLLLEKLKKTHRTFLLSNTNEIHKIAYCDYLKNTYELNDFSDFFEKQYLSFEIGLRKPNVEIFDFVVKNNMLKKEETLFIDDSIQHIQGARAYGIDAFHLNNGTSITDLF